MGELLFKKITRLKLISDDFEGDNRDKLNEAYSLLSDPTINLDIRPIEAISEEFTSLQKKLVKVSGNNRDNFKLYLNNSIKEDKSLIKKKLSNMKIRNTKDLLLVSAYVKVIRKILSGMSSDLYGRSCDE